MKIEKLIKKFKEKVNEIDEKQIDHEINKICNNVEKQLNKIVSKFKK